MERRAGSVGRWVRSLGRKRALILASLAGPLAVAALLLWTARDAEQAPWWISAVYPPFCIAASIKAFRTSARRAGNERRAWQCFGLAALSYSIAEAAWTISQSVFEVALPSPSLGDAFYYASPLLFIAGFWRLRAGPRSRDAALIEIGNFGIILSTVLLAFMLSFYDSLRQVVPTGAAIAGITYGILDWSAPLFGLVVVYPHCWGRRRTYLRLLIVGLLVTAVTDIAYTHRIINERYSSMQFINVNFLFIWCALIWAAFERDWMGEINDLEDAEVESALEQRAKQWSTLIPAFAVASVLATALFYHERLTEELRPYAAATFLLFVVSLSLRGWWSHRAEVKLRSQAESSEARLKVANRDLLHEMQTRARVEEELRRSQKMEALGQLTGGIAHDFNNLLAVILGNLESAQASVRADARLAPLLRDAADAAARGAALTQRLLTLSREQTLKPCAVDVGELVAGMANLLERSLGPSIELRISRGADVSACFADPAQLESAILNLAINARDAMPEGGAISIEIADAEVAPDGAVRDSIDGPGSYVEIRVRDSGTGIEPAILPRVFDPFFTTKDLGSGTGLGLSIVYAFANQSGGDVTIESEPGRGTEVRLHLPASSESASVAEGADSAEPPRGDGESILVVEDQPEVRRLVGHMLEALGYRVALAADADEALRTLDQMETVDLLLTDVVLTGGMNGRDLAAEVGRRRPEAIALLMSGYAPDPRTEDPVEAPGADLLQKPFRRFELAQKVHAALNSRPSARREDPA